MTLDEFRKKYTFAKNMEKEQIKEILKFITSGLIDISMEEDNEPHKKSFGIFVVDGMEVLKR